MARDTTEGGGPCPRAPALVTPVAVCDGVGTGGAARGQGGGCLATSPQGKRLLASSKPGRWLGVGNSQGQPPENLPGKKKIINK